MPKTCLLTLIGLVVLTALLPCANAHKVTAVSMISTVDTVENTWTIELAMDIDPSDDPTLNDEVSPTAAAVTYANEGIEVLIDGNVQETSEPEIEIVEDSDEDTPETLKRRQVIARIKGQFKEGSRELVLRAHEEFTPAIILISIIDGKASRRTMTLFPGESSRPIRLESITPGDPFEAATKSTEKAPQPIEQKTPAPESTFFSSFKNGFTTILPRSSVAVALVIAFLFLGLKKRWVILQVASFTIAHSLALAIATQILLPDLPIKLIALICAGGVIYLAIENLITSQLKPWRLPIIFLIGIAFGLQFADDFTGSGTLPLIGFNLGLEIAQLVILAVVFLAIAKFVQRDYFHTKIALPVSVIVLGIGLFELFRIW